MPYLPRPEKKIVSNFQSMSRKRFYNSPAWKQVRAGQIIEQPYCIACFAMGILTDCTKGGHVDHIIRIEAGGAPLDPANLWTLCPPHSAKKTALESHGLQVDGFGPPGSMVPTEQAKKRIFELLTKKA